MLDQEAKSISSYLNQSDTICQIVNRDGESIKIIRPIEPEPEKIRRLLPTEERAIRALLTQRTLTVVVR